MTNWKDRLKKVVARSPDPDRVRDVETGRERVQAFFDGTVIPAFEELCTELEKHGRETEIDVGRGYASLTVIKDGDEEFSYAIRGRVYHKMSFAFPELRTPRNGEDPRVVRAEVMTRGESHEASLQELTKERIISEFLDAYGKWMGW